MGGFEGGDEGGFWDLDKISTLVHKHKSIQGRNTKKEKDYIQKSDTISSIKAIGYKDGEYKEDMYDTLSFVVCSCETFTIEGCDGIPLESNSIYKAYKALCDFSIDSDVEEFFEEHKVVITKGIPLNIGLGGASSDAAAFLCLVKEMANLVIGKDELIELGRSIKSDVAFFITNYLKK